MTPTLDSTAENSAGKAGHASSSAEFDRTAQPSTIVLQPRGSLEGASSPAFQADLERALDQVTDAVIVDLLWVKSMDAQGIEALVAGIQRAAALGKFLSFQSMDAQTRAALTLEWNRQRQLSYGPWNRLFKRDLERFLDGLLDN